MKRLMNSVFIFCMVVLAACHSSTEMGGSRQRKEKPQPQAQPPAPKPSQSVNATVSSPQVAVVSNTPTQTTNPPASTEKPEDEFAESPDNILGTFLTINRIGEENEGKSIRLGITLVDAAGNKANQKFDLSYKFRNPTEVNTDCEMLSATRSYNAICLITAQTPQLAQQASSEVFFYAAAEVDGSTVVAQTSGRNAQVGTRGGDAGLVDRELAPPQ